MQTGHTKLVEYIGSVISSESGLMLTTDNTRSWYPPQVISSVFFIHFSAPQSLCELLLPSWSPCKLHTLEAFLNVFSYKEKKRRVDSN